MNETRVNILSFGSLEEFGEGMQGQVKDNEIRVEGVIRKQSQQPDRWINYLVVVTALRHWDGNTAACLLRVGGGWTLFRRDEPHHSHNLDVAVEEVKSYLVAQGFSVAPGVWNSGAVLDNGFLASTTLWTFQEGKLIPMREEEE